MWRRYGDVGEFGDLTVIHSLRTRSSSVRRAAVLQRPGDGASDVVLIPGVVHGHCVVNMVLAVVVMGGCRAGVLEVLAPEASVERQAALSQLPRLHQQRHPSVQVMGDANVCKRVSKTVAVVYYHIALRALPSSRQRHIR